MAEVFNSLSSKKLTDIIKQGGVGVIPTDTLYGLVCDAANKKAVNRLYALKMRKGKPGTLIAADINQLVELGIKYRYLKAVEDYWPGAVSVVLPITDPEKVYLHQGEMSLAVRVPKDVALNKLLKSTGSLLTSSANKTGESPVATIQEAQKIFGGKVDFYVDGGDLSDRQPSTIVRIIDDAVEVLREGAVKI